MCQCIPRDGVDAEMCTQRACDNAGLRGQQIAKPPTFLLKVPAASLSKVFKVTDYMPLFVPCLYLYL